MLRRLPISFSELKITRSIPGRSKTTSVNELQAKFRDPSSPYYIPPGTRGPEAPDSPTHTYGFDHASISPLSPLAKAHEHLMKQGFDPQSFWEQRIVWGDHDSFQHVNNVRYARFFESSRIHWLASFGRGIGGPEKAEAMVKGRGVSLILKSMEIRFRRPVTYPDTLLIGYTPVLPLSDDMNERSTLRATGSAYSLAQEAFVTHSKEEIVWYDYDRAKKCDPGDRFREVVYGRIKAL
ncbi:hypothetical protein AGABI2DRAFT_222531 [Agaricus bisporus var. bisporus H97]|uniref:hypothetical protein n=1 Tax=Agaricus bisporus var. bisporus (strain H97 / ATCC MYA-4626 / FGSC 10389) TaxID=936046 RepID=UPI00029F5386|nr:hypothetical protein AGABI2DRAFT_222531 [Agaricus bisporus var. bisporus H97]EKV46367.1 hypothetical protein AGABI2DRAFT_222531 [Agaricus bisporus var. bisporus H97]